VTTVRGVENRVHKLEGFSVNFTYEHDRSDVRGDKQHLPSYGYQRAAPGRWTVAEWRAKRFNKSYPSYGVNVRNGSGKPADGRMKLSNLRWTYNQA